MFIQDSRESGVVACYQIIKVFRRICDESRLAEIRNEAIDIDGVDATKRPINGRFRWRW